MPSKPRIKGGQKEIITSNYVNFFGYRAGFICVYTLDVPWVNEWRFVANQAKFF